MRLNSSRARSFAESAWGTGGTTAYRTNRRGAYYFSCSGHGGYVVDSAALSAEEREAVSRYVKPYSCFFAERASRGGECYLLMNPHSYRSRRYPIYSDTVTGKHDVFFFEEDCDWSVLEKFTDIRSAGIIGTPEQRAEAIESTFNRWCAARTERA